MPSPLPNMTPERWQQLQSLFHEIADLDEDARKSYLDEHYSDDPQLCLEIQSLINTDQSSEDTIKTTIKHEAAKAFSTSTVSGERIGAYKVLKEVGHGGMGTVYLAERADDEFKKNVAIKLLRYTITTEEERQRFRNERQLLADLEHPNIARLLDGGTRGDDSPYIVMEYIHGESIRSFIKRKKLPIKESLQLFLKVCEAIEYAHQHDIMHLDIKPGNILVTEDGTPKLVDFGIARQSHAQAADIEMSTSINEHNFTPEYASPELIRGQRVSATSDVYALGVLLYELLSGQHPYRSELKNKDKLESLIPLKVIAKPSEVSGTAERRQELRGDLDDIIMKAINKSPKHRYKTIATLADDIKCYLNMLPIQARSSSLFYRFARFYARQKSTVTAIALLFLTVALITALITMQKQHQGIVQDIITKHTTSLGANEPPTVMVIPLINGNTNTDKDYFTNGLSNELIADLSRLSGIQMLSRTTAASLQNQKNDPIMAAKGLGANYVIHGTVTLADNLVKIDAAITNTDTGQNQWSSSMSAPIDDLFTLQNTLAKDIAHALNVSLSKQESRWLEQNDTYSYEAYDAFLSGLSHYSHRSANANQQARNYFEDAIRIDPAFARAYATLANTYRADYVNTWSAEPEKSLVEAERLAKKAIIMDDRSPQIHFVMGLVLREMRHHTESLAAAAQAIALNPNYADGFVLMASVMCFSGTPNNSVPLIEKAMRLNPRHPTNYSFHLGQCHYVQKEYEKAASAFKEALQRNPTSQRANLWLAATYAQLGKLDDADWVLSEVLTINPRLNIMSVEKTTPFTDSASRLLFLNGLKRAGLTE